MPKLQDKNKDMNNIKRYWTSMPTWLILGALVVLVPIFIFWTLQNINKQKENSTLLLLEKGDALIRSFEAGARVGLKGMLGTPRLDFKLQGLLDETAQQPGIFYITIIDAQGSIIAHNDPDRIGAMFKTDMDLNDILLSNKLEGRQVANPDGSDTFEVYRPFTPKLRDLRPPRGLFGSKSGGKGKRPESSQDNKGEEHFQSKGPKKGFDRPPPGIRPDLYGLRPPGKGFIPIIQDEEKISQIIFVGLDMGPIQAARQVDTRNTVIMALILLLIGFTGIVSIILLQAYRSTKTTLTQVKAFSDKVVDNMPIGLLALGAEGRIASFNETAESILQLSSQDILGEKAEEVLFGKLNDLIEEIGEQKEIIEKEIECTLDSGQIIPLEITMSPLEGDDNNPVGYIILIRDLTEVQELKKEIERTQRLASLGTLAAGVAHEIRNPLSSIKGFATYFMERYKDVPEGYSTAGIMVQEVERLNRVVGQLLEFARPMSVQKRKVAIRPVIQHSLKMIERQAHGKDIIIKHSISPQVKEVILDPDRFNQVLSNLYLNSIEAMEDGGTLSVELAIDSGILNIIVSDTGIGMSSRDLGNIFDPYFTTKSTGTGLGLAIVHNIIEAHKGEARVESEPGKGTTFRILLPQ